MNREEAIRQLDGADVAVLNRDFFKFNQAIIMAISALRQQDVTDTDVWKNEPLTLDELRQMDGDPVWVCFIDGVVMRDDGWFIFALLNESQAILEGKHPVYKNLEVYGKTWLAYRQKPEEGTV